MRFFPTICIILAVAATFPAATTKAEEPNLRKTGKAAPVGLDLHITYTIPLADWEQHIAKSGHLRKRYNKDGHFQSFLERIPVVGYISSAVFAARNDRDRAIRAAARCTGSTVQFTIVAGIAMGTTAATVGSGGIALPISVLADTAAGATSNVARLLIEAAMCEKIRDDEIRSQCVSKDGKTLAKAAVTGAIAASIPVGLLFDGFANAIDLDVLQGLGKTLSQSGISLGDRLGAALDDASQQLLFDVSVSSIRNFLDSDNRYATAIAKALSTFMLIESRHVEELLGKIKHGAEKGIKKIKVISRRGKKKLKKLTSKLCKVFGKCSSHRRQQRIAAGSVSDIADEVDQLVMEAAESCDAVDQLRAKDRTPASDLCDRNLEAVAFQLS